MGHFLPAGYPLFADIDQQGRAAGHDGACKTGPAHIDKIVAVAAAGRVGPGGSGPMAGFGLDDFDPPLAVPTATTLGDLRDYYGLPIPDNAAATQSVGGFLRARLRGRPAAGDRVDLGRVTLSVRQASGGVVRRVGLRVAPRGGDSAGG